MKKTIILLGIVSGLFLSTTASAQKINVGASVGPVFPVGDAADGLDAGFGFDASIDFYTNKKFDIGVESGLKSFGYEGSDENFRMIPLMLTLGFHKDLNTTTDLYGELGGGAFFTSNSFNDNKDTNAGISPRVGLAFELTEDLVFLDTNLSYTSVFTEGDSNFNWIGLNVGLLFTIN